MAMSDICVCVWVGQWSVGAVGLNRASSPRSASAGASDGVGCSGGTTLHYTLAARMLPQTHINPHARTVHSHLLLKRLIFCRQRFQLCASGCERGRGHGRVCMCLRDSSIRASWTRGVRCVYLLLDPLDILLLAQAQLARMPSVPLLAVQQFVRAFSRRVRAVGLVAVVGNSGSCARPGHLAGPLGFGLAESVSFDCARECTRGCECVGRGCMGCARALTCVCPRARAGCVYAYARPGCVR